MDSEKLTRIFDNVNFLGGEKLFIILDIFSREQLRNIARKYNIPIGKNKTDTMKNIWMYSDYTDICVEISIHLYEPLPQKKDTGRP